MDTNSPLELRSMKSSSVCAAVSGLFVAALLLSACGRIDRQQYTLYRTGWSVESNQGDEALRIYIASFDLPNQGDRSGAEAYNLANCDIAKSLFMSGQPHALGAPPGSIKAKYWCEKGSYRP